MALSKKATSPPARRRPPATTPEGRENQMIALAIELAERQLSEGTASSQVITHYLKLGTTRETLEKERIRRENELLQAKVETLSNMADSKVLYEDALNAMRTYSGNGSAEDYAD